MPLPLPLPVVTTPTPCSVTCSIPDDDCTASVASNVAAVTGAKPTDTVADADAASIAGSGVPSTWNAPVGVIVGASSVIGAVPQFWIVTSWSFGTGMWIGSVPKSIAAGAIAPPLSMKSATTVVVGCGSGASVT